MNAIADTNTYLAVVLNEPEKPRIIELSANREILSPEILPYEIGNALSAIVKRKRLTADEALTALQLARAIPVKLVQPDISKSLEIALKFKIYAYDAYFLQCALSLGCPLLTLDQRMQDIARQLSITVLE
jgi:predicted nucleic acid-binding protein